MKLANNLFYIVLFLGFLLPTNVDFFIKFPGVLLPVREFAFILLPLVNLFCRSSRSINIANRKLKALIACFLIIIFFTEFLKHFFYYEGIENAIKTIRMGLPLFSSLILVYTGIRADIEKVWKTLLCAVSISSILSLLTLFVFLPIYPPLDGQNILEVLQGRLVNSNCTFGFIALYFILKDKGTWYNKGWLPVLTAFLSISSLIMSFNRTYLALLILAFLYLSLTNFSVRKILRLVFYPVIAITIFMSAYNYSDVIKNQVDTRILDVVFGATLLSESVYENNRDVIFDGVSNRINQGYWLFGLSYNTPIYSAVNASNGEVTLKPSTDTSVVNILLRYGFLPFLFFISIFYYLISKINSGIFIFSFVIYFFASFNTDAFVKDNSVFFLLIIYLVQNYYPVSRFVGSDLRASSVANLSRHYR